MGSWNANWELSIPSGTSYADCAVGRFTLKKVNNGAAFKVHNSPNAPVAKWLGATFVAHTGDPGPLLGWPLMKDPEPAHSKAAGKWVREKVQEQWDASQLKFEYLEGEVQLANGPEKILLFKADKCMKGGKDFLVGIRRDDLNGGSMPDGSVSGRRR